MSVCGGGEGAGREIWVRNHAGGLCVCVCGGGGGGGGGRDWFSR